MPLSGSIHPREFEKFELTTDDETAVRVIVKNGTGEEVPVTLTPAVVSPTITNLSLATANTEVDHTLQTNLKQITIRNRDNGRLQFSFTDGQSGSNYITIPAGATFSIDGINYSAGTLSIQSNKASQTVEILEWS